MAAGGRKELSRNNLSSTKYRYEWYEDSGNLPSKCGRVELVKGVETTELAYSNDLLRISRIDVDL
jgi:hypothetical protein